MVILIYILRRINCPQKIAMIFVPLNGLEINSSLNKATDYMIMLEHISNYYINMLVLEYIQRKI